jgi:hypothetical protein
MEPIEINLKKKEEFVSFCKFVKNCRYRLKLKNKKKYPSKFFFDKVLHREKIKKPKKENYYDVTIKGPNVSFKFRITKEDSLFLFLIMRNIFIMAFYAIILCETLINTLSVLKCFKVFFDFKNLKNMFYFFYNFYDEYKTFDEEMFIFNQSFILDLNYIKYFNFKGIFSCKKLLSFNKFETYYGLDKREGEEDKVSAYDYDLDFESCNLHFFLFCLLEMCVVDVKMSFFNINFFGFKKKQSKFDSLILPYSKFFLKIDFFFFFWFGIYNVFKRGEIFGIFKNASFFFGKL